MKLQERLIMLGEIRNLIEDILLTSTFFGKKPELRSFNSCLSQDLSQLKKYGFCPIKNLITTDEISEIKKKISSFSMSNQLNRMNEVKYVSFNTPFLIHPVLTRLASNPYVLDLVESYFNRESFVSDCDMRRIYPCETEEIMKLTGYSSSNWHRDSRGRQLKLMVYFTDVGPKDSNFAFFPGSHKFAYLRGIFNRRRFSDNEMNDGGLVPIEWMGKAGEAYLFDTNLIHRLRRKKSANVRDSFTVYYTPGQELRYLELDEKLKEGTLNRVFQEPKSFYLRPRMRY